MGSQVYKTVLEIHPLSYRFILLTLDTQGCFEMGRRVVQLQISNILQYKEFK